MDSPVVGSPVVGSPPGMGSPVVFPTVVLPPPQPTRTVASPTAASAKRLRLLRFPVVDETCFESVMGGGDAEDWVRQLSDYSHNKRQRQLEDPQAAAGARNDQTDWRSTPGQKQPATIPAAHRRGGTHQHKSRLRQQRTAWKRTGEHLTRGEFPGCPTEPGQIDTTQQASDDGLLPSGCQTQHRHRPRFGRPAGAVVGYPDLLANNLVRRVRLHGGADKEVRA